MTPSPVPSVSEEQTAVQTCSTDTDDTLSYETRAKAARKAVELVSATLTAHDESVL